MRLAGHVMHMGEMKSTYNILYGRYEGKRPFEGLKEVRCEGVHSIHLTQNRFL
jgi:hypothetical protein